VVSQPVQAFLLLLAYFLDEPHEVLVRADHLTSSSATTGANLEHGRNAVQAQRWLGHSDPGFTLRAYVHLLDDDLGEPLLLPVLLPPRGDEGSVTVALKPVCDGGLFGLHDTPLHPRGGRQVRARVLSFALDC
jgi:hypothetical protein